MNSPSHTPHPHSPRALAFKLSLPIFLSYFPLGIVFGALFAKLHTYWYMAPIMSAFVYSGTVQFVTIGLMQQHASYFFIFLSVIFIAGRNMFYGLSLFERYQMPAFKKTLSIFLLVDTNYAIVLKTPPFKNKEQDTSFCLWLGFFFYLYWLSGSFVGALFGQRIPGIDNLEFVLIAFFAIMLLELYRQNKSFKPIVVGLISFAIACLLVPLSSVMLVAVLISCVLLVACYLFERRLG